MTKQVSLTAMPEAAIGGDDQGPVRSTNPYANKTLPRVQRTTADLSPYAGPWGIDQVIHLLRRTTFGAAKSHIDALTAMTMSNAVDTLLAPPPPELSQPLTVDSRDVVPVGQTWVNSVYKDPASSFNPVSIRTTSLKAWWIGLMLNQQLSIREKMVLFWHNHFATEMATVQDPRFTYRNLATLRLNALGNFRDLTAQISVDGAMLRYLNGNTNTKTNPNENYGRELQELFTVGKGTASTPTYTEDDVKAAARVLTGWRDFTNPDTTLGTSTSLFDATRHDSGNKTFSSFYQGTIITGSTDGARELNDLLTMIFLQNETARFICRKFYRWFVYYVIDQWTEDNIIAPLAATLQANNYDILPVLSQLLKSAHFYDPVNAGCVIKNPIDHIVGVCRECSVVFPSAVVQQYAAWTVVWSQANSQAMNIGDPPNVAGWPAYYQTPEFYELWINSDTMPKRGKFTDTLMKSGYSSGGGTFVTDPIAFVQTLSDPTNANVVIDEFIKYLLASPVTDAQRAFLKDTLLPGLGTQADYEWSVEWGTFMADPTNTQKRNAVKSRLQALLTFMCEMPEYQLS